MGGVDGSGKTGRSGAKDKNVDIGGDGLNGVMDELGSLGRDELIEFGNQGTSRTPPLRRLPTSCPRLIEDERRGRADAELFSEFAVALTEDLHEENIGTVAIGGPVELRGEGLHGGHSVE